MNGRRRWSGGLVLLTGLIVCAWWVGSPGAPAVTHWTGQAFGSRFELTLVARLSPAKQHRLGQEVVDRLEALRRALSRHDPDSELVRFNRQESLTPMAVSADLAHAVERALQLGRCTAGAFDPTIAPLLDVWGIQQLNAPAGPTPEAIAEAKMHVGLDKVGVTLDPPMMWKLDARAQLDLGGIGKGFAVDCISNWLNEAGYPNHLFSIAGEVRANGLGPGGLPWNITIDADPSTPEPTMLKLRHRSVSTSSPCRQVQEAADRTVSHLIDPRTGQPLTRAGGSVTVVADDNTTADALATALAIEDTAAVRARICESFPTIEVFKANTK